MAEQWWAYIQRHLDERGWTPSDLSRAANINRSIIGRWREGAKPEVTTARSLASALGRPLIEVLVASGLLTPEEADVTDVTVLTVGDITDDELVAEVAARLAQRGESERPPLHLAESSVEEVEVDETPPPQEQPRSRRRGGARGTNAT